MGAVAKVDRRWTMGLIMLSVVIVLWVLSSFLINMIFRDGSYRKPFFITYMNTVSFVFYLLPLLKTVLYNIYKNGFVKEISNLHNELVIAQEGVPPNSSTSSALNTERQNNSRRNDNETAALLGPSTSSSSKLSDSDIPDRLSLNDTILLSLQFCSLWFLANLVTNASLAYTSVASQTILSSTSSFFTLFIGAIWKIESITKSKLASSIVSFVGILLVTHSDYHYNDNYEYPPITKPSLSPYGQDDDFDPYEMVIGNLLALSGALLYSIYSILLKHKVKDESRLNMQVFFGFVGFFTMVLFWPVMILLQYYGWETFELPSTTTISVIVVVNCFITFISDYCWANAMLLTTPLVVTVGLSITIPLAMLGDFIFINRSMNVLYITGAVLIMGSFFVMNNDSENEQIAREQESIAFLEDEGAV